MVAFPPLVVTPFDIVADKLGKTPDTVVVVGNNGLVPPMIFLMGTERAAMGGAERIEVREGDESAAVDEDDGGGGGSDFMAVI